MQQKDTIYIDVDDEITAIIDKLTHAEHRIVALVLPKRATVLQSIVNMKLLKRTAEKSKKHIVLITTEAGLLPLAGAVGLHVASSLQSKPAIPRSIAPDDSNITINDSNEEIDDDFDPDAVADQPIGKLAGASGAGAAAGTEPETIDLDNDEKPALAAGAAAGAAAAGSKAAGLPKKNNKLKIPNFNKFRLLLILGGAALIGLLVFFYFAVFVLPKAMVTINTDSSDVTTNTNVTLDPKATALNADTKTLPAKIEQKQQNGTQQVPATGQKNKGTKASGEVKIINCTGGEDLQIPAGTGVSSGGITFVTQEDANISLESSTCKDTALTSDTVKVIAINAGAAANIAAANFTVAGQGTNVKASSSEAMSGGTDDIVKVVTQSDIDAAKQKIGTQDTAAIKAELGSKLQTAGYISVPNSLVAGEPVVTPSASVGTEVDVVTVSQTTLYTMYGVKKTDIRALVVQNVNKSIDTKKQKILSDGVDKATFDITSTAASGPLQAALSAKSVAGPDIDTNAIKTAIAGKKANDVRTIIKATPGVTDVTVKYSPFWVSSVPNKISKITVVIDKADASSDK